MAHRIAAKPQARIAVEPLSPPPPLPFDDGVWAAVLDRLALPPQQARVLELVMRAQSDKQVAERMGIRLPTVRTHLSRMFRDLGVADRIELIILVVAMTNGRSPSHRHG